MYPRLKLARNLLTDDGVIFISIDDNEVENLRKLCDEIFGEDNYIDVFIWINKPEGRQISKNGAVGTHEYIMSYAKNSININEFKLSLKFLNELMPNTYNKFSHDILTDEYGDYIITHELYNGNSVFNEITRPNLVFDIYYNPETTDVICENVSESHLHDGYVKIPPKNNNVRNTKYKAWRWGRDKVVNEKHNLEFQQRNDSYVVYTKRRDFDITNVKDIITNINTNAGTQDINNLSLNGLFDFPKPVNLIKFLSSLIIKNNDIILDFFAGSSTIYEAIFNLNLKNNLSTHVIGVQIPEEVEEDSKAFKSGFETIADIGKERIRRAGDKIKSESNNNDLDTGFKVFKLDSSNLDKWNPDYDDVQKTLLDSVNNVVSGRSELDLVYEIIIKYGIDLSLAIEEYNCGEWTVYSVGYGALLICLDNDITKEIADFIIKLKNKLDPITLRVVFKDNGFVSDSDKTNIKETLKINNINEFITI
jgi:adenine-specific DNA-methyltransferase